LIIALVLGIFVAYMVLASQFNSFIDPVSVLVALPFSLSGAFIALLCFGQSLNIYSMIGLILLMGIVKKNSILLVEFTNTVRDRGQTNVKKALLEACPIRLRPIIMTSFACITAAIPEALSFGAGSETTVPMAVSIIGGVTVSTFLTLFVVPCVYELFSRIQKREANMAEIQEAFAKVAEAETSETLHAPTPKPTEFPHVVQ
jgi:HAE1 family hydrophobic/amphiphilic exporter-1